jgi:hypothetical protein
MNVGMAFIGLGHFSDPDIMAHIAVTAAERCGLESLVGGGSFSDTHRHKTKWPIPDGEIPGGPDALRKSTNHAEYER